MKLNYKRTICVGFAFFLICAFWQAYDNTVPLILTNKFGMSQAWSGVIMALDNILALFLLPLFGAISDKHSGKRGRRTPFILIGTIVAAIAFISLSLVDDAQLKNLDGAAAIDDPAALRIVYQKEADRTLKTPDGETFVLEDTFTEDEFAAITSQVTNELCRARASGLRPSDDAAASGCAHRLHRAAAGRARCHGHVPLSGRCAHA